MGHISQYLHDQVDSRVGDAVASVRGGHIEQATVAFSVSVAYDKDGKLVCSHTLKDQVTLKGSWRPPEQASLPGMDGDEDAEELEGAAELENALAEEDAQLAAEGRRLADELAEAGATVELPPDEEDEQLRAEALEEIAPDLGHCSGCGRDLEGEQSWAIGDLAHGGRRLCAECVEREKHLAAAGPDTEDEEAAARVRGVPPQEAPEPEQYEVPFDDGVPAGLEPPDLGGMTHPEAIEHIQQLAAPAPAPKNRGGRPPILFACSQCRTPVRAVEAWGVTEGKTPVALKRNDRASALKEGEVLMCASCTSKAMDKRREAAAAEPEPEAATVHCPHNIVHPAGQDFGVNCPMCRAQLEKDAAATSEIAPRETCSHGVFVDADKPCPYCAAEVEAAAVSPPDLSDTLKCDTCGAVFPTEQASLVDHVSYGPHKNEGSILCPVCMSTRVALGIGEALPSVFLGDRIGWPGEDGQEAQGVCIGIHYPPKPDVPKLSIDVSGGNPAEVKIIPYATEGLRIVERRQPPPAKRGGKRRKKPETAGGSTDTGNGGKPTDLGLESAGEQITGLDSQGSEPGENGADTRAVDTEDTTETAAPGDAPTAKPVDGEPASPSPFPYPATGAGGHCSGCGNPLPDDKGLQTRKEWGCRFNSEGRWLCPECARLLAVIS